MTITTALILLHLSYFLDYLMIGLSLLCIHIPEYIHHRDALLRLIRHQMFSLRRPIWKIEAFEQRQWCYFDTFFDYSIHL